MHFRSAMHLGADPTGSPPNLSGLPSVSICHSERQRRISFFGLEYTSPVENEILRRSSLTFSQGFAALPQDDIRVRCTCMAGAVHPARHVRGERRSAPSRLGNDIFIAS